MRVVRYTPVAARNAAVRNNVRKPARMMLPLIRLRLLLRPSVRADVARPFLLAVMVAVEEPILMVSLLAWACMIRCCAI